MALLNNTPQEYYNDNDYGNYQFVSLADIIKQFMYIYVGEDKIISKASKTDVAFHAQRALAELSFDTLKSCKAQEYEVPATLQMPLPQDYVNYTRISWVDDAGIKHPLYPTKHTSNPSSNPLQDDNGDFKLQAVGTLSSSSSDIVLDKEYKDILVGMKVIGPYIPENTFVKATSNSGSITTITIEDVSGIVTLPTESNAGTTLNFENVDGSLLLPQKESFIVENLSWDLSANYKITAASAADIADIKVGMIVSHDNFPVGTIVTNVNSTTIVVSELPDAASVTSSTDEITFISPDKVDTTAWANYKLNTPSENNKNDYEDDVYWPVEGNRYGIEPSFAQVNGSFYIDCVSGKIYFSSNIAEKTVILDYISDSLGTDEEMQVHKFAEEAMYRSILHAVASGLMQTQQLVPRLKKEKFAAVRTAKLRLSNLKIEELTQIMRGKSKWIKH